MPPFLNINDTFLLFHNLFRSTQREGLSKCIFSSFSRVVDMPLCIQEIKSYINFCIYGEEVFYYSKMYFERKRTHHLLKVLSTRSYF